MTNLFTYTKTEGQGWLVEKPEMEKPFDWESYSHIDKGSFHQLRQSTIDYSRCVEYEEHLATLRRFKYDYPCEEGAELVEGKDFRITNADILIRLFPEPPRTYSEQDLLDVWDAAIKRLLQDIAHTFLDPHNIEKADTENDKVVLKAIGETIINFPKPDSKQYLKQKFNIEIK